MNKAFESLADYEAMRKQLFIAQLRHEADGNTEMVEAMQTSRRVLARAVKGPVTRTDVREAA